VRALSSDLRARAPLGLAAAVALYLLLRGLVLYTAFDQTALEMYELYPMGTIPKVLMERGPVPLHFYYDNAAGQILTGLLALPFYLLLGAHYLALKLVPLTIGLGALVLVWLFLDRNFSRAAANAGALLFALGPTTTLAKYSMMASGNHFENLAFTMLVLVCFYRLHALPPERRTGWLLATGVIAGFSVFVFLGALLPVGMLALFHLGVRGWRCFARDLTRLVPAFLLGISPLLYLNLVTGGRGLFFLQTRFGEEKKRSSGVLERAQDFLFEHLPKASFFDSFLGLPSRLANLLFLAAFAVAWLAAAIPSLTGAFGLLRGSVGDTPTPERERRRFHSARLVPLFFLLPLTALAYGTSDLILGRYQPPVEVGGYRYFLPTLLSATLLIAIHFGHSRDAFSSWGRRLGTLVLGLALFTGLWNFSFVDFEGKTPNLGVRYAGHNFVQSARGLLSPKNGLDDEGVRRIADAFRPLLRRRIYSGIGFFKANQQWNQRKKRGREKEDYLDLDLLLDGWPVDVHVEMLRGAGAFTCCFERMIPENRGLTLGLLSRLAEGGDPRAVLVAEGASTNKEYPQVFHYTPRLLEETRATLRACPPNLQPAYARGSGILCGRLLRREIPAEVALVEDYARSLPPALSGELLRGMGIGLADGGDEPALPDSALALVPLVRRGELLSGYASRLVEVYGGEAARELARELGDAELRQALLALLD
jgi:hypothetical protein